MKKVKIENFKDTKNVSVIALARQGDDLDAVELKTDGQAIQIISAKTEQSGFEKWPCSEYKQINAENDKSIVVAFDSSVAAFYRFSLPAVNQEELANMIELQAEARFPLPADQIELAWRADQIVTGQSDVTAVVARKDLLENFAAKVKCLKAAKIILDSQAIVIAWQKLFDKTAADAIVLSLGSQRCQICYVSNNALVNTVNLDMGLDDISENRHIAECFIQDVTSSLSMFQVTSLPIFVLSDGDERIEKITSMLRSNGVDASVTLPEIINPKIGSDLTLKQIYQYHIAIGTGLIGLDTGEQWLNIFSNVYQPEIKNKKIPLLKSVKATCILAAAMFFLMIISLIAVDMASARLWKNSKAAIQCNDLVQKQRLRSDIATRRINLLELLNKINKTENSGIEIFNFNFKQGQAVSMRGQAPSAEQLTKFEKSMAAQSGISDVKLQNPKADTQSGKINFSMTFQYGQFTKKNIQAGLFGK